MHKNMAKFIRSTSHVSSYAQIAIGTSSAVAYAQTKKKLSSTISTHRYIYTNEKITEAAQRAETSSVFSARTQTLCVSKIDPYIQKRRSREQRHKVGNEIKRIFFR